MEYASNAKGNTGVALGAVGTGLGAINALGGMAGLAGLFNGGAAGRCYERDTISRHELDLVRELMDSKQANAILVADGETEKKLVEVYNALARQDKEIRAEIEANYKEQAKINRDQAVYNGVNTAAQECMKGQIARLYSLTALRIPNTSVCPGWGDVTVTPVTPEP